MGWRDGGGVRGGFEGVQLCLWAFGGVGDGWIGWRCDTGGRLVGMADATAFSWASFHENLCNGFRGRL